MPTIITAGDAVSAASSLAGSNDGALSIVVGPAGGKLTALTIDATGRVAMPLNVVAFSAYMSTTPALASATSTKAPFDTKDFDTTNSFNTGTYRYQPAVAGYYQFTGILRLSGGGVSSSIAMLYKNGVEAFRSELSVNTVDGRTANHTVSGLIYLNGSTDFVELFGYIVGASSLSVVGGSAGAVSRFQGILIARA